MYTYTHICEELFTKTTIFEFGVGIVISFSGMALNSFFLKELFKCMHCTGSTG